MVKVKKKTANLRFTARMEKFCHEYLIDLNATQAAIRSKYSKKTANRMASENLSKPVIQARIKELQAELQKNTGVTAESVVAELAKVGFSNIKDFIESDNNITDLSDLPRELTAAVESVQADIRHDSGDSDGYTEKVKFKLHSKLAALDQLGRHLGLFEKDKPAEANITINILNYNGNNATI